MTKRGIWNAAFAVLAVLGMAALAWAGRVAFVSVSATQTAQTVTFAEETGSVTIVNKGSNEIFFELYGYHPQLGSDTVVAATTSSSKIDAGDSLEITWGSLREPPGGYYTAMSIICSTGETSTVYLYLK